MDEMPCKIHTAFLITFRGRRTREYAAGQGLCLEQGGEPNYYHGPHELCIIAGGPQHQLILS